MDSQHIQNIISRAKAQKEANRLAMLDLQDKLSDFKSQLYSFDSDLQKTKLKFNELTGDLNSDAVIKTMLPLNIRLAAS
jgi:predicted  nucleic acid-binding Zn-ribbon protein